MRRSYIWLTMAIALVVTILPASKVIQQPHVAQAQSSGPQTITLTDVPGLSDVKHPDVLGVGSRAYIAAGTDKTKRRAVHIYTDQPYNTFSGRVLMGDAYGQSDYSTSKMAKAQDGTLYQIWSSSEEGFIKIRRLDPNTSNWSSERTLSRGKIFRANLDIAVTSEGRIFVTWWQDGLFYYSFSDNRGEGWSSATVISSSDRAVGHAALAGDYQGSMWVTYGTTGNKDTAGRIIVGQFVKNGSGFSLREVGNKTSSNYFNDPTITVFPSNIPAIAWRDVNGGIYYAERNPSDGVWNRSRLIGSMSSYGRVSLVSDSQGNLHLGWGSAASGGSDVWYAFKPFGQNWQGPIQISSDSGDLDANLAISQTLTDAAYGHMVDEHWTGSGIRTRYVAMKNIVGCAIKSVTIDNGAQISTDTDLQVSIVPESSCQPTQMQVSLNVPPTAATPRVAYSSNVTVSIPAEYTQQCIQTVYVTLYKNATDVFNASTIASDTITEDLPGDVDASVSVRNPNLGKENIASMPFPTVADAPGSLRASDGDPAWTGLLQYYLAVTDNNDCSKLKQFMVNNVMTAMPTGSYNGTMSLPVPASTPSGLKTFDVTVFDGLNSTKVFPVSINFDPIDDPSNFDAKGAPIADENGRPVLNRGAVAGDTNTKNVVRKLDFTGVNVTDNLYRNNTTLYPAGTQFWGVWIANSAPNQVNPNPDTLNWTPVKVPAPATSFSLNWSLLSGRAAPLSGQEGKYTIFVRFLDGAGNPTNKVISTTMQLDAGYSLPMRYLSVISR